ncbi:XF1762 family protein [Halorubrum halophilum]|uniref:XF1762 family protein n=1 Tax=Halorubrum halophilum TaxID=413816 RepID=UPI00374310AA
MAVLGRPSGRHNADGQTLELYRFAAHPNRPANTGSWLLSRCCRWATLEGYDRLLTYAGVQNDNEGTMYRAAGFTHIDTTTADLREWQSRSGRVGGGTYRRRRYRRCFSKHSLEARRPAGRVDAEQSHLIDRGTAHGGGYLTAGYPTGRPDPNPRRHARPSRRQSLTGRTGALREI